jgi:diguanylate cyclase (GGDEF)-like protein
MRGMSQSMPSKLLFAAQLELLMRNLSAGLLLSQVAAVVAASALLWTTVHGTHLVAWACVLFALLLARSWHMKYALDHKLYESHPKRLAWQLILGVSATGLCWVAAYVHISLFAAPTLQYLLLLVIVLLASLAMGASVAVREYYIAYIMTSLWPISWWCLTRYWDVPYSAVVGLLLLVSSGVLIFVCNNICESYKAMLQLSWERGEMAKDLQARNDELAGAKERLNELAHTDGLTKLGNRRALDERLEMELRRAPRSGTDLAVIMLDVDYFKAYNDGYGHAAGDDVLEHIAQVLSRSVNRATDFVARYGGEEFMVVLPNTDLTGARGVALHFQKSLARAAIPHAHSPVSAYLTVSQGLAVIKASERVSLGECIQRVDEPLYKAKQEGRNTIKAA